MPALGPAKLLVNPRQLPNERIPRSSLQNNRNLPLPRGTEAETWFGTLDRAIDWLSTSSPTALVVSLGLDTFVDDPISHFRLQQPDFMRLGQRLAAIELPTVLVMDSRPRLESANKMLNDLIECGFLIDEERAYKPSSGRKEPRLTEYKLTSTDYAGPKADLRRLVTPAGLAWLRSSAADLKQTAELIDKHARHPSMCKRVQEIFREHGCGHDLLKDGRPKLGRIWKVFYQAQLFASGALSSVEFANAKDACIKTYST